MIQDKQIAGRTKQPMQSRNRTGTVLVSGASGLVGQALAKRLAQRGQRTSRLVRSVPANDEIAWDPEGGTIDESSILAESVVHLAGESIAEGRWSKAKMEAIRSSRVRGTRLLCEGLARLPNPPAVLVSASAIGFYGEGGNNILTERSPVGSSFLADVCEQWEQATRPAEEAGIRVVNLRIGVVLAKDGGALNKMLLPFQLGLGGRIGDGEQFMSWILLEDLVSVICMAMDDEQLTGPVNATSPFPVSNLEFTKTLGKVLRRPTIAPMPGFAARAAFGRMAEELLLASLRVQPGELLDKGFVFKEPQLEGALRAALGRKA